jgi:hypothetical protein
MYYVARFMYADVRLALAMPSPDDIALRSCLIVTCEVYISLSELMADNATVGEIQVPRDDSLDPSLDTSLLLVALHQYRWQWHAAVQPLGITSELGHELGWFLADGPSQKEPMASADHR